MNARLGVSYTVHGNYRFFVVVVVVVVENNNYRNWQWCNWILKVGEWGFIFNF